MMLDKLTCPACQVVLRPSRPVSPGMAVTCPQCKSPFRARAADPGYRPTPAAHLPPASPPLAPPPPAAPPPPVRPPLGRRPETSPAPSPSSRNGPRLGILISGLALLILPGILALVLLLRGGSNRAAPSDTEVAEKGVGDLDPFFTPDTRDRKSRPKPLVVLRPDEEFVVKEMTAKGVSWLRKAQLPDGTWPSYAGHLGAWPDGTTAMAGLTLLSCEVDYRDDAVQKAVQRIRKTGAGLNRTYEIALCILFLDRLAEATGDRTTDAGLVESLTFRLIAGQTAQGAWHYHCGEVNPKDRDQFRLVLQELSRQPSSLLQEKTNPFQAQQEEKILQKVPPALKGLGVFGKPPEPPGAFFRGGGDNSNTQFGVLGLWAARKFKIPVDRPLQLAVKRFKESQNADGSWDYNPGGRDHTGMPAMTCAGLLAMAVEYGVRGKDELKGRSPKDDPLIKNAFTYVGKALNDPADPRTKTTFPPLYFIWSVERAGVLFQVPAIDGKDWYRWGMRILRDHQAADGSWSQGWHATNNVADTCFALLFLHRVNLASDLTDQLSGFGTKGSP